MKTPAFWNKPPGRRAALLAPLAFVYDAVTRARMRRGGAADAGVPVVCVGNFTAGGAGKTPAAIAIAAMLKDAGFTPAFLSRGYGGSLRGPVRVDPALHHGGDVGDEPLLLARHAPAIVSLDRSAGAPLAVAAGADIIVMDDGLQNPSLKKTVTLAMVDSETGIGNGRVIPAGPLRASLGAQLALCDALIVNGMGDAADKVIEQAAARDIPVFRGQLAPDEATGLKGADVVAFAGIGRPGRFFATLTHLGARLAGAEAFADHHRYCGADAAMLLRMAREKSARLVTTEKDMARMAGASGAVADLRDAATALAVTFIFHDGRAFRDFLLRRTGPPAKKA